MLRERENSEAGEGSLWVEILGVADNHPGVGVGAAAMVQALMRVCSSPMGVHNPPSHS